MRKLAWLLAGMLLMCLPALAQNQAPTLEVGGSYSFVRVATENVSLNGGNGSFTYYPNQWIGAVGEIGAYHHSDTNLLTFLFGPRFTYRKIEHLTPFAQILFGGAHVTRQSESSFAMDIAGGLDITAARHVAVRAIQMDYLETRFGNEVQNSLRLSFGIVFRFFEK